MTRPGIKATPAPSGALHAKYAQTGAYTDCFSTEVPGRISQAQFVEAFYTTWVFKLERRILAWIIAKPSTDEEAKALAAAARDRFAAWTVEERTAGQLLMCDHLGHTRSWFMVMPCELAGGPATRLYFGSVVVPVRRFPYKVLIGFHRLYSRVLLSSARRRLAQLGPAQ